MAASLDIQWWSEPVTGYHSGAWNCADWINWHKKLKSHYGGHWARVIWVDRWKREQSKLFTRNELLCPFNATFLDYVALNDLDLHSVIEDVARGTGNLVAAGGKLFDTAGQLIYDASAALSLTGRIAGFTIKLLPVALAAGALYLATNKTVRDNAFQTAKKFTK